MLDFLKNLFSSTAERVAQTGHKRTFRPSLELLEDRQLMSVTPLAIANGIQRPDFVAVWIDNNIRDASLNTLLHQNESDHVLNRNEMIGILAQAWTKASQSSTSSVTLYADLEAIVHNPTLLGTPDYVEVLANKVVNHDQANGQFQGTALGDLQPGSAFSSQLVKLTYKWFLGADHPSVGNQPFAYQQTSGTLFGSGVSYTDVRQGSVGDCYFLAALEETARVAPSIINTMFIDNGDNTYTVRFYHYNLPGNTADYVTVDKYLPTFTAPNLQGNLAYAHSGENWIGGNMYNNPANKLWVALAEKAYAQVNESGWIGRPHSTNIYGDLTGGFAAPALSVITGVQAYTVHMEADWQGNRPSLPANVGPDYNAGYMVEFETRKSPGVSNVVGSHAYALLGYDAVTKLYTIGNPWGATNTWVRDHQQVNPTPTDPNPPAGGTVTLTADQLQSCIDRYAETPWSVTLVSISNPATAVSVSLMATPSFAGAATKPGNGSGSALPGFAANHLAFNQWSFGQATASPRLVLGQPEQSVNGGGRDKLKVRSLAPISSSSLENKRKEKQAEGGLTTFDLGNLPFGAR